MTLVCHARLSNHHLWLSNHHLWMRNHHLWLKNLVLLIILRICWYLLYVDMLNWHILLDTNGNIILWLDNLWHRIFRLLDPLPVAQSGYAPTHAAAREKQQEQ